MFIYEKTPRKTHIRTCGSWYKLQVGRTFNFLHYKIGYLEWIFWYLTSAMSEQYEKYMHFGLMGITVVTFNFTNLTCYDTWYQGIRQFEPHSFGQSRIENWDWEPLNSYWMNIQAKNFHFKINKKECTFPLFREKKICFFNSIMVKTDCIKKASLNSNDAVWNGLIELRPRDVSPRSSQTPECFTPVDVWPQYIRPRWIFDPSIFDPSGCLTPVY